jgi:diguanylate cyclase (GGDEF)-like protein
VIVAQYRPSVRTIVAMSYAATRRLVLIAGLGVLLLIAAVMFVRRVDTVEVLAAMLFIPVFLAFVFWGLPGGLAAGLGAAVVYAALRNPAMDAVGPGRFVNLIVSRGIGYVAFGALGGWAAQQLERSLEKLDVYDQVDDETGLYNARFFVQHTDLEMARAARYKTLFSVAVVDIPTAALDRLGRRQRVALLKQLGRQVNGAVRTVDRAVHARDGGRDRLAVICPETGAEGARIFVGRLAESVAAFLRERGVSFDDGAPLAQTVCTVPGDDDRLQALREEFAAIDREQHPEHPVETAAPVPRSAPPRP